MLNTRDYGEFNIHCGVYERIDLDELPIRQWNSTGGRSILFMVRSLPQSQRSERAALRLICLPYAGGGTAGYHRWRTKLPAAIEVVALSLPGHDGRLNEPLCTDLQTLVEAQIDSLAQNEMLDRPFALLGHSMGAWLAFEIARTLRRRNLPMPGLLIVTASRPPAIAAPVKPWHQLPDDDLVARVDARYGGIPPAIRQNPDALRLLLPALRADLQMIESYRFNEEPPLDVDILALGGTDDPAVSVTQINDWHRHTTREFSARLLPGGHFFLFQGTGLAAAGTAQSSHGNEDTPALRLIVARLDRLVADQAEPSA